MLAAKEEIIITRNGTEIARLQSIKNNPKAPLKEGTLKESAESYHFKGKKASYEEFLKLASDEKDRYEYIDGEIYLLASPRTKHQYAVSELLAIFHERFRGDQCRPFVAPYDIRLKRKNREEPNVVQPDLMVICDLDDHLDERDYYIGVPSLVVEVLSESTRSKDMVKKLDLYMESGVKEYWIVNPLNREVVIYYFEKNEIKETGTFKHPEMAKSFLIEGLLVELDRIFK